MTASDLIPADDHAIHAAFGPPPTDLQATAAMGVGVVSLLLAGLISLLFGALVNEGRLSQSGIGLAAGAEALVMAISTGLFGALVPTRRLKLIGVVASLLLVAADTTTMTMHGNGILLLRGAAGVPEGILLWITIAMIARTATPERWAAVLFTSSTISQVVAAGVLTAFLMPRFGANAGFAVLAASGLICVVFCLLIPDQFTPLPKGESESGAPPPRGWLALAAIMLIASAAAAVGVYLLPIAEQHGLTPKQAGFSVTMALTAQILGGALATVVAGRVRYLWVLAGSVAVWLGAWLLFGVQTPAWVFFAAMAVNGIIILFVPPFFIPMTIEVDASRRTAVQSGAVQLLAGAIGPLLAATVVGDKDVHGVLWMGAALLLGGLGLAAVLHYTAQHDA
jgi:predicted MFS family arabinose efflux permease